MKSLIFYVNIVRQFNIFRGSSMVERLPVELGSVEQKCSNENRANSGKPFPAPSADGWRMADGGWQSRAKFRNEVEDLS